ncbi:MAG: peptidoglycan-binding domain-containing protein [Jatrophihabitans sp.]
MSSVAFAPSAIYQLFNAIKGHLPEAELNGVVAGPNEAFYGYHWAAKELPKSDDSRVGALNTPPADPGAASALDVKLGPDSMKLCTSRLIAAAKAGDRRMLPVRELCGTTDGRQTHNYEVPERRDGLNEWEPSHLWHIHLSFYRRYSLSASTLLPVAEVFAGKDVVSSAAMSVAGAPVPGSGWPLAPDEYFGLVTGPKASHGGYHGWERPYVTRIQKRMQKLGYAPAGKSWADGVYEKPTAQAVAAWQHAKWASVTSRYGEVWSDDWARLF